MKAISTLTIMPTTKAEITNYVRNIKESVLSGDYDLLEFAKILKSLETIVATLRKDTNIKDAIESDLDNYNEKTFDYLGCKFQKRETPSYDFSACEDSEYDMLENESNRINIALKARKEFLKSLKDFYVNQETGEVVKPPIKTVKSNLAITLK
jgi:hypothetical protein